jgi:SAM-dependent methyltransferase
MGLSLPLISALAGIVQSYRVGGELLALGVQTIRCGGDPATQALRSMRGPSVAALPARCDHREVYRGIGFERSTSIDLFEAEGPDRVVDLGGPMPADFHGAFDAYLDAGTLEHVFDVRASLSGLIACLKPGGIAIHLSPLAGFENHGFYQFGPKLFARLYAANGFRDLQAWAIHLAEDCNRAIVEPILDHDAPLDVDPAAYHSLVLYSARLRERRPFRVPLDTHLADCAVPRELMMPPDQTMLAGLARSGFTRRQKEGAVR